MAQPSPPEPSPFVAMPEVRRAIEGVLQRIPRGEREDAVQEVLARLVALRDTPSTLEEYIAYAIRVARNWSVDELRKRASRAKFDDGPLEDPDAHGVAEVSPANDREPIDDRRKLEVAIAEIDAGRIAPRAAKMLQAVAEGAEQRDLAKELGLAESTVRNEVTKARAHLRARWAAYLAVASFAALLVLVWIALREKRRDDIVQHLQEQQRKQADELRNTALHDCDARKWQECLDGLNRARDLDQRGDVAPEVVAARQHAEDGLLRPNEQLERDKEVPRDLPAMGPDGGP